MRTRVLKLIAAVGLAACATADAAYTTTASAVASLGAASSQAAVWVPRKLYFDVIGRCVYFRTSINPCDSFRDEIRTILQQLGARDVVVTNSEATFSALEPAESAAQVPGNVQKVQARWDKMTLHGEAVIMSQVNARILPLFATRNLSQGISKLSQRMTVEVLRPVSSAAVPRHPPEPLRDYPLLDKAAYPARS